MRQPYFSTDVVATGATATVLVRGELDLATAPDLRDALVGCLDHRYPTIDVDLRDVTFMACAGINVLLAGRRSATTAGLQLAVVRPSPVADRLMTLAHTRTLIKLGDPDSPEAVPA